MRRTTERERGRGHTLWNRTPRGRPSTSGDAPSDREARARYVPTLARACQEDSEISVGRAMNADEEMENTDPTENAAMAEDFGKTIKNALNGGQGPLLKLMKVRATFPRDGAPREPPAILFPQSHDRERTLTKFEPPLDDSQGISETLSKVGQGEDGGELKTLPKQLILKGLLGHKDKVRCARRRTGSRLGTLSPSPSAVLSNLRSSPFAAFPPFAGCPSVHRAVPERRASHLRSRGAFPGRRYSQVRV